MSEKTMTASTPRRRKGCKETSTARSGVLQTSRNGVVCSNGAVLGEIAAGLAHHPDGKARGGFASASAKE